MGLSVTIKGVNRVRNSLRGLTAMDKTIINSELRAWAQRVRRMLKSKPYPSKRAGQRYARTGRLANSWGAEQRRSGEVSIRNSADYATWVVGDKQAWMHAGRWWQARPTIEDEIPELTRELSEKIQRTWGNG